MNRGNLHQEVLPINHHMLVVRDLRVALQPTLEVEAVDQLRGSVIAHTLLILCKKLTARGVRHLYFTFHIQREDGFRQRFEQCAQRQMLAFRRHPRHRTDIGHAGNAADLRHQAAEVGELQFSKIKVNSPDGVNLNTA